MCVNLIAGTLPDGPVCSIIAYLSGEGGFISHLGDERTIIATAAVCRNWRDNITLKAESQAAAIRVHYRLHIEGVHREMAMLRDIQQGWYGYSEIAVYLLLNYLY